MHTDCSSLGGRIREVKLSLHDNLGCSAAHSASPGTLSAAAYREDNGQKITTAELSMASAPRLPGSSTSCDAPGVPVSTPTSSLIYIRVGAANRFRSGVMYHAYRLAWLLTIPVAGAIGALVYGLHKTGLMTATH